MHSEFTSDELLAEEVFFIFREKLLLLLTKATEDGAVGCWLLRVSVLENLLMLLANDREDGVWCEGEEGFPTRLFLRFSTAGMLLS